MIHNKYGDWTWYIIIDKLKLYIYIVPFLAYTLSKALYMQLVTSQLRHH